MQVLKVNSLNPNPEIIKKASDCLKKGGVIVYPTDTCYGLGADITNPTAVAKIYKIKNRPANKPLSIIVKNVEQLKKIAIVDNKQEGILKKHLPGPFTFILPVRLTRHLRGGPSLGDSKIFNQPNIGIRIPDCKLTQLISDRFLNPYTTTSANKSGLDPCYNLNCLLKQFKNTKHQPDLILDAGSLLKNPPSTVVDLTKKNPALLRQGSGKFQKL